MECKKLWWFNKWDVMWKWNGWIKDKCWCCFNIIIEGEEGVYVLEGCRCWLILIIKWIISIVLMGMLIELNLIFIIMFFMCFFVGVVGVGRRMKKIKGR